MNRREFVSSSVAALACMGASRMFGAAGPRPIGLQIYTLRDQAEKNLPAVLEAVHKIGYAEVELYWSLYSHPASELRKMLDEHGLKAPAGHFDYDGLESKLDYARALGLTYVICPMLPERMWNSLESFQRAADQFNKWGEKTKSMGMRFGFHNHNYEFQRFGQTTGFETLLARTDPKLVCFELDCYWLTQAGHDPVETIRHHADRVRLLHIKDRKPGFPTSTRLEPAAEHFTEVGTGSIDWKAVVQAGQQAGVEHFIVEQDKTAIPALESIAISYRNLRRLL